MNISNSTATAALANPHANNPQITDSQSAEHTHRVHETEDTHHSEGHHKEHEGYHRDEHRALGAFSNEVRQRITAMFRVVVSTQISAYNSSDNSPSPNGVAADTVSAAQRAVAQDPASAGQTLSNIRTQVNEAATVANQAAGNDPGTVDVNKAASQVNQGLDALAASTAQNTASSASVLSVESTSKQQSTIRIRTQEGDTVNITLGQSSQLSAAAFTASDAAGQASGTQIALANGSKLSLHFEGNINDQELAAIQDVFKQAATIANDFFGGDLAAAINDAQGFQFNTDQLARVSLGFRSEQVTNASFASASTVTPASVGADNSSPAATTETAPPATSSPSTAAAENATSPATVAESTASTPTTPTPTTSAPGISTVVPTIDATVDPTNTATPQVQADTSGLAKFFDQISSFLRSVAEGFQGANADNASVQYHFSQSFKLEILKSVAQVAAPDTADGQLAAVNTAIDSFPTTTDPNKAPDTQAA